MKHYSLHLEEKEAKKRDLVQGKFAPKKSLPEEDGQCTPDVQTCLQRPIQIDFPDWKKVYLFPNLEGYTVNQKTNAITWK